MARKTRGTYSMKNDRQLIALAKVGTSTDQAAAKLGTSVKAIQRMALRLGIKFDGGPKRK
jgi:hypothetical protein